LPEFTENPSNDKNRHLNRADIDRYTIPALLEDILKRFAGKEATTRFLDFGCGRGTAVGKLRSLGWAAYGVDIVPSYISNGAAFLGPDAEGEPILRSFEPSGRTPFKDGTFDIVVTDQVLEHVENLDAVIAEIARVMAPGAYGLHLFPARLCVVEQHLHLPLVQWAPTNAMRRQVISLGLRAGLGAPYFKEYSHAERCEIFSRFVETETFNPSTKKVIDLFAKYGVQAEKGTKRRFALRGGIAGKLAGLPVIGSIGCGLYDSFWQSSIIAHRPRA
jgi:SAM-dependent methyltransferase